MSRRLNAVAAEESIWRSAPGIGGGAVPELVAGGASVSALHAQPGHDDASRVQRPEPPVLHCPTSTLTAPVELAEPQVRFDAEQHLRAERPVQHQPPAVRVGESLFTLSVRSVEPISDVEASAFAGRFACDFQSFDEDAPWRRSEVLREVLADAGTCTWGWSGAGRQRADAPLPGRIYRRSDTVVFVEVIVRATPYVRASVPGPALDPENDAEPGGLVDPPGTVGRSCAPPESDVSWTAGEPRWVRMTVPVTRAPEDGRLVVDPGLLTGPTADETGGR